jgi:uncharacterized short protein YbdD (DUF466 family)
MREHTLKKLWHALRALSGDDAYERYLAHWRVQHADEGMPLDRKAFFRDEQERKWNGIKRCC